MLMVLVINSGVRFRKRGETIDLGGWAGSACLSAGRGRGWGLGAGGRSDTRSARVPDELSWLS